MEARGHEEVGHTAEWSIRVWAPTMTELFIEAAHGMLALLELNAQPSAESEWRDISLRAPDHEGLLVKWLHEILFGLETRYVSCTEFDIQVQSSPEIDGRVREVPAARPKKHIKAVTYHELDIQEREGRLETMIVFDV